MTSAATAMESQLHGVLKRFWGYSDFRPLQREAIDCVLAQRDSVVVLPTGGGKSLCYQVPALVMPGMAVIVSPLISLMKDQVDTLKAIGARAAHIHSGMTLTDKRNVDEALRGGRVKLLYVSPERLVQPAFIEYLRSVGVSFIAVDEAHCISHWGHDFRPEYRKLRALREAFPEASMHAFTATATPHVREDIVQELTLRDPRVIVGSFDRPNLVYRVGRRHAILEQVCEVLEGHPGNSGLIFCISRKNVDVLAQQLRERGHKALPYHAGMDDAARKRHQEAFVRDEVDIIVATIAFGMGIDKSNVRFVIHTGLPKSIEHYQQETGRAGRDGLPSDCWLFHSTADFMLWKGIIEKEKGDGGRIALEKLEDMHRFAARVQCRRHAILHYFGEEYPETPCGACDTCLSEVSVNARSSEIARVILGAVRELDAYAGPTFTTLLLEGSKLDRVRSSSASRSKYYGVLRKDQTMIRTWIEEMVHQGYLVKRGQYNTLSEGPALAADATLERVALSAEAPSRIAPSKPPRSSAPSDRALFDRLREVRRDIARERDLAPFVICSDATLHDMAKKKPRTLAAFRAVSGVGEKKAAAFGDVFIQAIREFCGDSATRSRVNSPATQARLAAQEKAFALFAQRVPLEEVAEKLQRNVSTIEGYLEKFIDKNDIVDPEPWADRDTLERVRAAAAHSAGGRLKPVYEALNGEVSYGVIRVCLACLRNGA